MVLASDLDAVLNNLNEVWLNCYNRDYNDNMTLEDWTSWKIDEIVKPECGKKIFDYLRIPGFFSSKNMKPLPMAQEITKALSFVYDFYVVTAYIPETCVDKCEFIDTYYPWIGSDRVIFCNDKSIINANYLIDDGPHNHDNFGGRSIVFDYRYSRDTHPDKVHVNNWEDIGRILL